MSVALSIVSNAPDAEKPETVAQHIRRLQAEAKQLARDHVAALIGQIVTVQATAAEIASGGDAYSHGAREMAERLVDDCERRISTLTAITARNREP